MAKLTLFIASLLCSMASMSQDNYEIQVYASPTMLKGYTMFELHSNYTFDGQKTTINDVYPSNHALHETLEITQGIANNFELGFYIFTSYTGPHGYQIIGSHIRPRVSVPECWNWPFGFSLSTEFGYQQRQYSTDTWSLEIRPIIDKQWGNFYLSLNPTFGISIKPDSADHVPDFEPNVKLSYAVHKLALGFEYYGDLGAINDIPEISQQNHALFLAADLDLDPRWEINFGPGWGLTRSTDRFVFKIIIGRRIHWNTKQKT